MSDKGKPPPAAGIAEKVLLDARILIVEDEWIVAYDLAATLAKAGATVVGPALTLSKAKLLAENEPHLDAALLDYRLGREDAIPVIRILAARKIPFVVHTGHATPSDLSEWPNVPVAAKPTPPKDLVLLLHRLIRRDTVCT